MISVAVMWDDGLTSDLRLIDLLRRLEVTSTFAISPAKHKKNRSVNDSRGDYGTLVSKSELKEFADFEICNHTNNHLDLGRLDLKETRLEIDEGRKNLEDIFGREINGFCYPYGVYTPAAIQVLREQGAAYARTTKASNSFQDHLLLHPTGRWNEINLDAIGNEVKKLIVWGHTYELRTEMDWKSITDFYEKLAKSDNFNLTTFKEISKQTCY